MDTRIIIPVVATLAASAAAQHAALVVEGLSKPVEWVADPDNDTRFYCLEQDGKIRVIEDSSLLADPFYVADRANFTGIRSNWERGLLGMAFDPLYKEGKFGKDKYFYINYTDKDGATQVSRFTSQSPQSADPASELKIITIKQPAGNHNGGCIRFGPDGYLYIGMGDGGSANDPWGNAQNLNAKLGKLLRIDVASASTDQPYKIPPNNPFAHRDDAQPEVWSYGLRNPWRFAFDSHGRIWMGDVGQNRQEWVHVQAEGSKGGENYGWNVMEGPEKFRARPASQQDVQPDPATLVPPVWSYSQRSNNGQNGSITGGFFYEGTLVSALKDRYICTDFMSGRTWSFKLKNGRADDVVEHTENLEPAFGDAGMALAISSFGIDNDNELYMIDHKSGRVFRIVP